MHDFACHKFSKVSGLVAVCIFYVKADVKGILGVDLATSNRKYRGECFLQM
jgi:hypothetical protein